MPPQPVVHVTPDAALRPTPAIRMEARGAGDTINAQTTTKPERGTTMTDAHD